MEETPKKRRLLLRAAVKSTIALTGLGVVWGAGQALELGRLWFSNQAAEASSWVEKKLTREVVVREFVNPDDVSVEMLLEQVASEEHLPVELLKAMVIQESGEFNSVHRARFEPSVFKKYQKAIPVRLNDIERELWASSHGLGQVIYVLHYKRCGLEKQGYVALYDPLTNLRCTAKIFKEQWVRFKDIRDMKNRLFMALRGYNGDTDMPETADYATAIMNNMVHLRTEEIMRGF